MIKIAVILPGAGRSFRRAVRDAKGKPVRDPAGAEKVLTFEGNVPVELSAEELAVVKADIGPVLKLARVEHGKPIAVVDHKATAAFLKDGKIPSVEKPKALPAKEPETNK